MAFKWVADQFNTHFGSNTTHIANSTSGPIHVSKSSTMMTFKSVSSVIIPAGDNYPFDRSDALDYFSVVDSTGKKIVDNYPVRANDSYVVTKEKGFVPQKYGSGNLHERR
ncbi:hypothetical protein Fcan01_20361 [Folsomia candida]|uniref:Uncharacterized protein n=1 Tax=Folsomia candida TaxID=158441 RepID=A0A226DLL0_FOLCA|nr:hypothetical protein Fcan01_20361 [Folsomia candida]